MASVAEIDSDQLISDVSRIEAVAETILANKQHLIELDKKLNASREASRVLSRQLDFSLSEEQVHADPSQAVWLCFSNQFFLVPAKGAKRVIDADFDTYDREIRSTRATMKEDIGHLDDLEKTDRLKGFATLNPLTKSDMDSVKAFL